MYILMNAKCEHCGGSISVITFYDEKKVERVDCGRCIDCLSNTCLPPEMWESFKKYCVNIESIN